MSDHHRLGVDEPTDEERIDEGPAAPGEPAERDSAEDGTDSLELGFAQVYQSAGDCLEDDVAGTEDSRQAEEQENPG
jgi:hypothetical protein